ncbi:hypothetical protein GGI25_005538 [Coemansia spiralis]|uniref:NmrA-like domain-containing protein n=2 Tax=Coemansia TaxID=4863 RepID=A0A9W8KUK6_9FUNG|nr:hypothetical protein BX070DRAFT_222284 [Coemansia spiralis]KAJ1987911.1 hypothetical protein EDC05_005594 [Coemansia umbellata]KAJ2619470.1 hypothetical protein GGI26_005798 [Coemansia sp. RSA 1358]KAJ2671295.1 hypothetical protein GGI25_005538 [Coemansia spiralis]
MLQTVAIIGATGLQGGSVLNALYGAGKYKLIAITRNISSESAKAIKKKHPGVELSEANINDVESLTKAFRGADTVFGITQFFQPDVLKNVESGDLDAEYKQGKNIVDAAIAAGVKNMIYSSLPSMKAFSSGKYAGVLHFEGKKKVENYLLSKVDKICGAVVYLGFYMENYVDFSRISPGDKETVEFTLPLPATTQLPLVDTANDAGGVVAYILDHFDDFIGKGLEISSGYYEAQEMVKAFHEVTGKPARYVQIPLSALHSEELGQMFKGIEEFGYFNGNTGFLEVNKKMDYKHTTPVDFWKNRGWTGPS